MRKSNANRVIISFVALVVLALGLGARTVSKAFGYAIFGKIYIWACVISAFIIAILLLAFLFENRINKGFRYFANYFSVKNRLEKQLIDAGFGIQRSYYIELPKIILDFDKDYKTGTLNVRNTVKHDKRLDDVVLSSALGKFVVERHYLTHDENFYVYELLNYGTSFKLTFNSFEDFRRYSSNFGRYRLFLDDRSRVKLQSLILVGLTGSGKTYALYSLILQMLHKKTRYELYFADPKNSSLAVLGQSIDKERTATSIEDIILLLEDFVNEMHLRKKEMNVLLQDKLEADYSDFALSPHVFIIDEYAAFSAVIATRDKKTRDKVSALLHEVVLEGRQLGFFVFLVMQKSDATLIDTAIRENVPLKIVFGQSGQQTYVTAFGTGVDIPNRHYDVGEGVFTEPTLAPQPKLVQFPYLNFDILSGVFRTRVM